MYNKDDNMVNEEYKDKFLKTVREVLLNVDTTRDKESLLKKLESIHFSDTINYPDSYYALYAHLTEYLKGVPSTPLDEIKSEYNAITLEEKNERK